VAEATKLVCFEVTFPATTGPQHMHFTRTGSSCNRSVHTADDVMMCVWLYVDIAAETLN